MAGEVGTLEEWLKDAADNTDRCRPHFYRRAIKDEFKSQQAGRAVYYDEDFVRIEIPGESKLRPDRKVTDDDKRRWPKSWEAYQKGIAQPLNGTPIEEWAILSPGQVETFKAAGIRTIEDVRDLPDSGVAVLGPNGYKMRDAAKSRVAPAPVANAAVMEKLASMEREMEALRAQNAQLMATAQPNPPPAPEPAGDPRNVNVRKRAA